MPPPQPIVDGHGPDATHPPGPAHERLAAALRRVTNQLVLTAATPDQLTEAADQVEAVADALAPVTPEWALAVPAFVPSREPHGYFPFSPQIGLANPLAPPLRVWVDDDDTVHGAVNVDAAYEGPPGCVHGGIIASLFDEILGVANITAGVGAMTGTLTVVYRSPTPLKTDLVLAARMVGIEGRKVRAAGTIHAGDRLCAEAEGIFIMVDHDTFHLRRGER
ncbi:MAG: PaaI family thioesterase [Actinomycetota bacterium]